MIDYSLVVQGVDALLRNGANKVFWDKISRDDSLCRQVLGVVGQQSRTVDTEEESSVVMPAPSALPVDPEAHYYSLQRLFGQNFLGIEAVREAFTLSSGRDIVSGCGGTRESIQKALWDKCLEPDIVVLLNNIRLGIVDVRNWLLVLRTPFVKVRNRNAGITMKVLEKYIGDDMLKRDQGKLLYDVDWYLEEPFYAKQAIESLHWQFVTKACAPGTKDVSHGEQTIALNAYAQKVGLNPTFIRRRIPVEGLYDYLVTLRSQKVRLLENEYDWADERTSFGNFVRVGNGDALGLRVGRYSADGSYERLGACLSR